MPPLLPLVIVAVELLLALRFDGMLVHVIRIPVLAQGWVHTGAAAPQEDAQPSPPSARGCDGRATGRRLCKFRTTIPGSSSTPLFSFFVHVRTQETELYCTLLLHVHVLL